jgi:hypothetical protein
MARVALAKPAVRQRFDPSRPHARIFRRKSRENFTRPI